MWKYLYLCKQNKNSNLEFNKINSYVVITMKLNYYIKYF